MKRILTALLLLVLTTPAWGHAFERGLQAYERREYATALQLWRPLAERGDARAQVYLGYIYQDGAGVPHDFAEAARWYHMAADQGDEGAETYLKQVLRILTDLAREALAGKDFASALRLLEPAAQFGGAEAQTLHGLMHYDGLGVTQDYEEATKWFRKAAEQGETGAQLSLGDMYYYGRGVPQDYAETAKWRRLAAEQGDAAAQSALGVMYYDGQGVTQDYVQAHMWFNLSATRYHPVFSTKPRDTAVSLRDRVAAKMTPDQIAEAQRLAREWRPKK